jgi:UDP-glucose 4-epimerase
MVTGLQCKVAMGEKRAGDPAIHIASSEKEKSLLELDPGI